MCNIQVSESIEGNITDQLSDQQTFESLKTLARILLSVNHSEVIEIPVINLNPTPEKLAA